MKKAERYWALVCVCGNGSRRHLQPEGEIVWKKGDTVQEIVTDEKGMACAENLFPGKISG